MRRIVVASKDRGTWHERWRCGSGQLCVHVFFSLLDIKWLQPITLYRVIDGWASLNRRRAQACAMRAGAWAGTLLWPSVTDGGAGRQEAAGQGPRGRATQSGS